MRPRFSFPARALCFVLSCCVLWWSGCSTQVAVEPRSEDAPRGRVESITVMDLQGRESSFAEGYIDGNMFRGRDHRGERKAIPLDEISFFKIYKFDAGKTVVAILGVAALLALGVLLVAELTSCPHVYSDTGDGFVLDAEPFSGAIASAARRTDLQALEHLEPRDGTYTLLYANEVAEIEHTDQVKLWVADADSSLELVPDGQGDVLAVGDWELPSAMVTRSGTDIRSRLGASGEFFWEGEPWAETAGGDRPRDQLELRFRKPAGADSVVFLLRGNNTQWSAHMMAEFLNRFGKSARERLERLDADPEGPAKIARFMQKNGIWLEVQVRGPEGWRTCGFLREVGSTVVETQALRIPLEPGAGDTLALRLRWTPLFWNFHKVGVVYSTGAPVARLEAPLLAARDARTGDVRGALAERDGQTYRTVEGDIATLTFAAPPPPAAGLARTAFIEATGHYSLVLPDGESRKLMASMLQVIRRQGLDAYSVEKLHDSVRR